MSITTAGPLAAIYADKKVSSLVQATLLAAEEADRMDTGFRLEADSASALAHVCAKGFTFAKPTQERRFVTEFTRIMVGKSLGRLHGAKDYALRTEQAAVSRKDVAHSFAGLDAAYWLSKHEPLGWDEAVAIGEIYAHAYTYTDRSLVAVYVQTFARCVRAK